MDTRWKPPRPKPTRSDFVLRRWWISPTNTSPSTKSSGVASLFARACAERDHCCPPVWRVGKRDDRGVLPQNRLHDLALYADAASMDDADFRKTCLHGLIQVFLHNDRN